MKAGRPKKYKEKLQTISVSIQPEFLADLEKQAQEANLSRNELLLSMLTSADRQQAQELAEYLKTTQELLSIIKAQNKKQTELLEKLTEKHASQLNLYYDYDLNSDPAMKEAIEKYKGRYAERAEEAKKQGWTTEEEVLESFAELVFQELNKIQTVARPSVAKMIIRRELKKL